MPSDNDPLCFRNQSQRQRGVGFTSRVVVDGVARSAVGDGVVVIVGVAGIADGVVVCVGLVVVDHVDAVVDLVGPRVVVDVVVVVDDDAVEVVDLTFKSI